MYTFHIGKCVNNIIFYFQRQTIVNGILSEQWTNNVNESKSWKTWNGVLKFEQKLGYNADTFIYENPHD